MSEIQQRCNKYPKSTQGEASPQTSALHQDELLVRLSAWIYSYPSLFDWVNTTCLHSSVLHNLYMLYNLQTDTKVRLSILALTQTCLLRAWTIDPRPHALCGEAAGRDRSRHRMTQVKSSCALSLEGGCLTDNHHRVLFSFGGKWMS